MRVLFALAACVLAACATAEGTPDGGGGSIDARVSDAALDDAATLDAEMPDAMLFDADIDMLSFTDDSSSDFQTGGGVFDETTVDNGSVAPVAYYTGGLLQHASDTGVFTDGTTATWAQVQGFTSTGKAAISWHTDFNWVQDTPPSVGLTNGEDWTMWYEGEIYLEAGTWTFYLWADDHGFVEIARPETPSTFLRVASANWDVEASGAFTATTTGWHPFRYAIAEQTVDALVRLRFTGPGVGVQAIPRHRLRTRVDQLTGMVQAGFDDSHGTGDVDTTIDTVGPGSTDWSAGNPGDLGMTAADYFTVRWTGQFRIDVAGSYTFRYVTDDGQRLWIDGTLMLNAWDTVTHDSTTGSVSLTAGWHDLVIEQTEWAGGAAAFLTVASGPDTALNGQPLPVARLRPVEGRSDRIADGAVNTVDIAIPDQSTVTSAVNVIAASGVNATTVDVTIDFTHSYKGDMTFSLRAPNNQQIVLENFSGDPNDPPWHLAYSVGGWVGAPVNGTWTVVATDEIAQDTGTLTNVAVTPHYSGGELPIPTSASYESTVRDLGSNVTAIGVVTWTERLPAGSDLTVKVRTGATSSACTSAAWSPALTASGGTPSVPPGQYLQYLVELTSNGDRPPALDAITINYSRAL